MLRLLGLVYLMAFLTLVNQGRGLIGAHGLLPAADFLDDVAAQLGGRGAGFWEMPTLFWLRRDRRAFIVGVGWVGVALSLAVMAGYANALILAVLCALQISVVAIGQDFYGFGWEIQLVETGFLCIFLCPLLDGRPFPRRPPPVLGRLAAALAGRARHGGRRPHQAARRYLLARPDLPRFPFRDAADPEPAHARVPFPAATGRTSVGVLFNHVVELAAPLLVFCGRGARGYVAGALMAGAAARADRQRQPVVPQLADAGADPRLLRRRALAPHAAARRWWRGPNARARRRSRRARRAR